MSGFVDYIIDILSEYGNIKPRKMFGGYGIYSNQIFFALVIEDELYFKADSVLAEEFIKLGSYPFTYTRENKEIALSYYYVPSEVIENSDLLKDWYLKSLNIAKLKKPKK